MKKKNYRVVKSELVKQQEKVMSKPEKKSFAKALKNVSKDPYNCPNSMDMFGPPSPEELRQWASELKVTEIDLILEYLHDKECLNKKGKIIAKDFWEKYIHKK